MQAYIDLGTMQRKQNTSVSLCNILQYKKGAVVAAAAGESSDMEILKGLLFVAGVKCLGSGGLWQSGWLRESNTTRES